METVHRHETSALGLEGAPAAMIAAHLPLHLPLRQMLQRPAWAWVVDASDTCQHDTAGHDNGKSRRFPCLGQSVAPIGSVRHKPITYCKSSASCRPVQTSAHLPHSDCSVLSSRFPYRARRPRSGGTRNWRIRQTLVNRVSGQPAPHSSCTVCFRLHEMVLPLPSASSIQAQPERPLAASMSVVVAS